MSDEVRAGGAYIEVTSKPAASFNSSLKSIGDKVTSFFGSSGISSALKDVGGFMLAPLNSAMGTLRRIGDESLSRMERMEEMHRSRAILSNMLPKEVEENAKGTMQAFAQLDIGIRAIAMNIMAGLLPVVKPLADRFLDVCHAVGDFITANPDLLQTIAKDVIAVGAIGAAFGLAGAAIAALLSPAWLAAGAIALIGSAVLAVTETLGLTKDMGFKDLFNSIKIDGVGLSTYMTSFWEVIAAAGVAAAKVIGVAWDEVMHGVKMVAFEISRASKQSELEEEKRLAKKEGNRAETRLQKEIYDAALMPDRVAAEARVKAAREKYANRTLGDEIGPHGMRAMNLEKELADGDLEKLNFENNRDKGGSFAEKLGNAVKSGRDAVNKAMDGAAARIAKETDLGKDGQGAGVKIDFGAMKNALGKIGVNVGDGVINSIMNLVSGIPHGDYSVKPPSPEATMKTSTSSLGTFSGFESLNQMGGTSVFEKQLDEAQKQTNLLGSMDMKLRDIGGAA